MDLISQWRKQFEKAEGSIQKGFDQTIENFESNKSNLKSNLEKWKLELDKQVENGEEKAREIRTKLESLQVQLALGKAEGREIFEEQSKKIEAALHDLYLTAKADGNKAFEKSLHLFDQHSQTFKTSIEIARLQLALGKMEAGEELDNAQKEIREKLDELKTQFKSMQETALENVIEWQSEHIKRMQKFQEWTQSFLSKKA